MDDGDVNPVIISVDKVTCRRYRILYSIEEKVVFRSGMYEVSTDAVLCVEKEDKTTNEDGLAFQPFSTRLRLPATAQNK